MDRVGVYCQTVGVSSTGATANCYSYRQICILEGGVDFELAHRVHCNASLIADRRNCIHCIIVMTTITVGDFDTTLHQTAVIAMYYCLLIVLRHHCLDDFVRSMSMAAPFDAC